MAVTTKTNTDVLIKDLWCTDPRVVRHLEAEFSVTFDVDVCGTPENRKAPVVITASPQWYYDCSVKGFNCHWDGLRTDWWRLGRVGFMNPPFSQKEIWIARAEYMARRHGMTIISLLPHAPTAGWYKHMEHGLSSLMMPDRRIQYIHPTTNMLIKGVSFETVVAVWKPRISIMYERISFRGVQA